VLNRTQAAMWARAQGVTGMAPSPERLAS
jgi:hypothetical protein